MPAIALIVAFIVLCIFLDSVGWTAMALCVAFVGAFIVLNVVEKGRPD